MPLKITQDGYFPPTFYIISWYKKAQSLYWWWLYIKITRPNNRHKDNIGEYCIFIEISLYIIYVVFRVFSLVSKVKLIFSLITFKIRIVRTIRLKYTNGKLSISYTYILILSNIRILYPWTRKTLVSCDPIFKTRIDDIRYLSRNFIKSLPINIVLNWV